jgi:glyoxylate/hydroxypyruvate reductase A
MVHKILFSSNLDRLPQWQEAFRQLRDDVMLVDWSSSEDPDAFEFALIWKPPPGGLHRYTRLKAIQSLGAGVNQLDVAALPNVPLARLIDPALTESMTDYAIAAVFRHYRTFDAFERDTRERAWRYAPPEPKGAWTVGVMGLGVIGGAIAKALHALGFPVRGWARTRASIDGVDSFAGREELDAFLGGARILINVLALTPETEGVLDRAAMSRLPAGAFVVNIGRGGHLAEPDLVALLDEGHIAGATLDVLSEEPPALDNPLLGNPRVLITPHVAGVSNPETAARVVLENFDRALSGRPLMNEVDRTRGY